jgi:hypothetical protein
VIHGQPSLVMLVNGLNERIRDAVSLNAPHPASNSWHLIQEIYDATFSASRHMIRADTSEGKDRRA